MAAIPLIFVSHASQDAARVDELVSCFTDEFRFWISSRDIRLAENYANAIVEGIHSSDGMLLLLSEHALASEHVRREVSLAIGFRKDLLPVCLVPDLFAHPAMTSEWRYWLQTTQTADWFSASSIAHLLIQHFRHPDRNSSVSHQAFHDVRPTENASGQEASRLQAAGDYRAAHQAWLTVAIDLASAHGNDDPRALSARSNAATMKAYSGGASLALAEHRAVLDLRSQALGEAHRETLNSKRHVAECMALDGHIAGALDAIRAVIELQSPHMARTDPDLLESRTLLTRVMRMAGDPEWALAEGEATLSQHSRPDDPLALTLRQEIGECLLDLGRTDDARPLLKEVLTSREQSYGNAHPDTLVTRRALASCHAYQGERSQAVAEMRTVATLQARTLGNEHPQTLNTYYRLLLLSSHESPERAGEQARKLALAHDRTLGPLHPETLSALVRWAECLGHAGSTKESLRLLRDNSQAFTDLLGAQHPSTLECRYVLGTILEVSGQRQEAHQIFQEVSAARRSRLGLQHPATLMSLKKVAQTASNPAEALATLRWILRVEVQRVGPDAPATLNARAEVGHALSRIGRTRESLVEFRQVLAAQERLHGPDAPETILARYPVLTELTRARAIEQAAEVAATIVESMTRTLGADHGRTLESRLELAKLLAQLGNMTAALFHCREATALLSAIVGDEHPAHMMAARQLAETLAANGDFSNALDVARPLLATQCLILGPKHHDTRHTDALVKEWGPKAP